MAGIIDWIEDRPCGTGRPPTPTIEVIETLRFFVREGVQWRELRATVGRACGSTLRRRLDDWGATALLRRSACCTEVRGAVGSGAVPAARILISMPHKANVDRRHLIPRPKRRVTNLLLASGSAAPQVTV